MSPGSCPPDQGIDRGSSTSRAVRSIRRPGSTTSAPGPNGDGARGRVPAAGGDAGGPRHAVVLAGLPGGHAQAGGGHGCGRHGRRVQLLAAPGARGRDALRHGAHLPPALRHWLRPPVHLHPEERALATGPRCSTAATGPPPSTTPPAWLPARAAARRSTRRSGTTPWPGWGGACSRRSASPTSSSGCSSRTRPPPSRLLRRLPRGLGPRLGCPRGQALEVRCCSRRRAATTTSIQHKNKKGEAADIGTNMHFFFLFLPW
ncbi:hypothetical protein PVAP13_4NG313532 [Panicum virgatum]|uniref:Uncharacterized protein n=1 Tax=Panicum virgatum TaxID=38727 RepID=A0A8T0TDI7_PANVG|nr:hypothetical protein PVAP13_4NG313532 [Panicum virgatum]